MKKVFIDGGAHEGESIDLFRSLYPDHAEYEIHSFEPNPAMWSLIEKRGVILHKVGLWNKDAVKDFFIGRYSEGSTFLTEKVSGKVNYREPHPTTVISLSNWIKTNFLPDDHIVLKLDIEGAEYKVIPDLVVTGVHKYIKEWYGELHTTGREGKIRSLDKREWPNLVQLFKENNINFKDWHNNKNHL
jgi:FkbM family methyltransferase